MLWSIESPIHGFPIPNPDDEDTERRILNSGNHAIVADPILPELPKARACQGFPNRARVFELSESVVKKSNNPPALFMP